MSELDKMEKEQKKSQVISEFLEWLKGEKGFIICKEIPGKTIVPIDPEQRCTADNIADVIHTINWPVIFNTKQLLAEFFNIDLEKVEEEQRELIEKLNNF